MEGTCPDCGYTKEFDVSADVVRVQKCTECGYSPSGFDGEHLSGPGGAGGRHITSLLEVEYVTL